MERDDFYKDKLNTERIATYSKLKALYNLHPVTIANIFNAGIDFAMEEQKKKSDEEGRAIFEAGAEMQLFDPDDPNSPTIHKYSSYEDYQRELKRKAANQKQTQP